MWPKLIAKARRGGLDVIQTYVFWNVHEPVQGQVCALSSLICTHIWLWKAHETYFENELFSTNTCFHCIIGSVQLWGEIRYCEVHQRNSSSRTLCKPQDWSIHRGRMEVRVRMQETTLLIYIYYLESYKLRWDTFHQKIVHIYNYIS